VSLSNEQILDRITRLLSGDAGGEGAYTDLDNEALLALLARVREAAVTGAPLRPPASLGELAAYADLSDAEVLQQLAEARAEVRAEAARHRPEPEASERIEPPVEPHPVELIEPAPAPPAVEEPDAERRRRAVGEQMAAAVTEAQAQLEAQAARDWEQAQRPAPLGWAPGVRSRLYPWMRE
jgi:hypothetical protein